MELSGQLAPPALMFAAEQVVRPMPAAALIDISGGSVSWKRLIVELRSSEPIVTPRPVGTVVSAGVEVTPTVGATTKFCGQPLVVMLAVLLLVVPVSDVMRAVTVLLWHLLGMLMNGLLVDGAVPNSVMSSFLMRTAMPSYRRGIVVVVLTERSGFSV